MFSATLVISWQNSYWETFTLASEAARNLVIMAVISLSWWDSLIKNFKSFGILREFREMGANIRSDNIICHKNHIKWFRP